MCMSDEEKFQISPKRDLEVQKQVMTLHGCRL